MLQQEGHTRACRHFSRRQGIHGYCLYWFRQGAGIDCGVGRSATAPTPALLLSLLQHLAPTGGTPGTKLADCLPWYIVRYALGVSHPVHGAKRER
jgi:hypothetical protein